MKTVIDLSTLDARITTSRRALEQLAQQVSQLEKIRAEVLDAQERAEQVLAVGTGDLTTDAVRASVEDLLLTRPMTHAELMDALPGVGHNRISAALTWLKRNRNVVNLGEPRAGVWSIPSPDKRKGR
jgi:hypothetical protein